MVDDADKNKEADLFVEMADRIAHRHADYLPAMRIGPIKLSPEARERWKAFLASIPPGSSFYCDTDSLISEPNRQPHLIHDRVTVDGKEMCFAELIRDVPLEDLRDVPATFVGAPEWKQDAAGPARRMKSAIHEKRGTWFQLECGHRFHVKVEESLEPSRCWPSFQDVVPCPSCA